MDTLLQPTVRFHTGRIMPALGVGTWQCTDNTDSVIAEALQLGYHLIDTSGDYGTQPGVGEGIKLSNMRRENVFVTTKVEEDDDAYEATKANLRELGLDHVDLMLIHRPPRDGVGVALWEGLLKARDEGLVNDIGVSNYAIPQLDELIDATGEKPVVNQIEWSPFGYSPEMLNYAEQQGIILQAYSPLTRGERLNEPTLEEIAGNYNKTPAQLIIRWNIQTGVVPIPKANQVPHLEENFTVFDFEITDEDMERIDGLNEHYSALGSTMSYLKETMNVM